MTETRAERDSRERAQAAARNAKLKEFERMDARTAAETVLVELIMPSYFRKITELVDSGEFRWVFDPSVPGVVGLVHKNHDGSQARSALVVVYLLDDDYEVDEPALAGDRGRCDTCGAPVGEFGCLENQQHEVALP